MDAINEIQNQLVVLQTQLSQLVQIQGATSTQMQQIVNVQQATSTAQQLATGVLQANQPTPVATPAKFKLPDPKPFSGKISETIHFLEPVDTKFSAEAVLYNFEERKILSVQAWTTGAAFELVRHTIKQASSTNTPLIWTTLRQRLLEVFPPEDESRIARRKMEKLRQTGSCTHYVADFVQFQVATKYPEDVLIEKFEQGLKDEVLKALVGWKTGKTLTEYQNHAVVVDNALFAARKHEKETIPHLSRPARNPPVPPTTSTPRETTARTWNGPQPMDLDSNTRKVVKLNAKLREQLQKEGKCFYYREKAGHVAKDCPKKKSGNSQGQSQLQGSH